MLDEWIDRVLKLEDGREVRVARPFAYGGRNGNRTGGRDDPDHGIDLRVPMQQFTGSLPGMKPKPMWHWGRPSETK
tara:strand:- start:14 stop:241 length:228 start_codon:yes stop_codon:yes gene_type:complete